MLVSNLIFKLCVKWGNSFLPRIWSFLTMSGIFEISMNTEFSPIVLMAYKRPRHLRQVIESLSKNPEANSSKLIVYSDGAKSDADLPAVHEVRQYLKSVQGFAEIEIHESPVNKGLAASVMGGVSETLKIYETCIVLEDDLVVAPRFLSYMNRFLGEYKNQEEVISIHGYCYPISNLPELFFIKGADCWGWATWRRGWQHFTADGQKLLNELERKSITREFDFDGTYPYTQMLRDQIAGKNNSWAIRWLASAYLAEKLTLYPGQSLVENIGMDGSGENCGTGEGFSVELKTVDFGAFRPPLQQSEQARDLFKQYFRSLSPPLYRRIMSALKRRFLALY
jgi:hypothetical protein